MNTITPTPTNDVLRFARLVRDLNTDIKMAVARRDEVLTQAEGLQGVVRYGCAYGNAQPGDRGHISEWISRRAETGLVVQRFEFDGVGEGKHAALSWTMSYPGRLWDSTLILSLGLFEVIATDGDRGGLAVQLDFEDEAAHRRMVKKLRRMLAEEGLRAQVRDHDVTVLDPMDTVLHRGDVFSAFRWLHGVAS